jgi:hypothetical protein
MKAISHRGNLTGPNKEYENSPSYIIEALQEGYDVEIDVWAYENELFLGHDIAEYKISIDFLQNRKLWCHAKNLDAFEYMISKDIHCFWHENEKCVLTSNGVIWCYPGVFLKNGITVMLEREEIIKKDQILGICTDYPLEYTGVEL